jgi:hypothetical protein
MVYLIPRTLGLRE